MSGHMHGESTRSRASTLRTATWSRHTAATVAAPRLVKPESIGENLVMPAMRTPNYLHHTY